MKSSIRIAARSEDPRFVAAGWLCAFALLALACAKSANTGSEDAQSEADDSRVVVSIDDEDIRSDEVDARIKEQLFEQQFGRGGGAAKLYDARRDVIEAMVRERLIERAAEAAGQDPESWMTAAVEASPPVSDEEVLDFFEANREQMEPGASFEAYQDRIRSFLESRRGETIVADLESAATIEVDLPRERAEVEAVGPSRGPESAAVTIVEFSDFQCPYCARVTPTLDRIMERFPDQVRVVYRHLPLDFHDQARLAAQASFCAERQGNFWDYHDKLFENQRAMQRPQLIEYAQELELDPENFETCLDSPAAQARVEGDLSAAKALGATGTPAFFINGIMISGAQPFEAFEAIIIEELGPSGS